MESIKSAMGLLEAVRATMDTISVVGIDNQDKFVGCANVIQAVSQTLGKFLQASESQGKAKQATPVTTVNSANPVLENIDTEVMGNA